MAAPRVALVFVLSLAGCTGDPDASTVSVTLPPGPDPALPPGNLTPPAAPLRDVRLGDCRSHAYDVPVDAAEAAALLPDGFQAVPFFDLPGKATGVLVVSSCTSLAFAVPGASAANGSEAGPVSQVLLYLPVQVPDAYLDEDAAGYRAVLRHATDAPGLRQELAAWNVTAGQGAARLGPAGLPDAVVSQDTAAGEGFSVAGQTAGVHLAPLDETTLRFYYVQDRAVVAAMDFVLQPTPRVLLASTSYQASGDLPLLGASGAGYGAHYDHAGLPGLVLRAATVPHP